MADPIFDTNIIIDWMKGHPLAIAELGRYRRHRISRISWMEVLAGEPDAARNRVEGLIARFEIVELDEGIQRAAIDIRHRTRMKLLDALILATARTLDTVLVSRNTKDFPAEMPGIRVPYVL